MKTIYKYILLSAVLLCALNAGAQKDEPTVSVTCNELIKKGNSLYIDAVINVSGEKIKSTRSLTLTPVLEGKTEKMGLPSVLLMGKRSAKVYEREKALHNLKDEEPHFAVINTSKEEGQVIPYKMTLTYEPWMKDARLVLAKDLCGCGKSEPGAPLLIAENITLPEPYQVQPLFAYIIPDKCRSKLGRANVDFKVNRWEIVPSYHDNTTELAKIEATIEPILNSKELVAEGIILKGYASPESPYANNTRLANNRVRSVRDYIREKYNLKEDFFILEVEPEDWEGFKERVEADRNVPARDEVLALINGSGSPDEKEARLKQLDGGKPYRYILREIFPYLRHTDYQVEYTDRFFTTEEGRKIIKSQPEKMCLSEMFAVAQTYPQGSDEYNEVFDIAVRTYSDEPVANLNAANIAMSKGKYDVARTYLAKAGNSPEAVHARGLLYLLEGNLDAAEPLLKQAEASGVKEATHNLNELNKRKADIR